MSIRAIGVALLSLGALGACGAVAQDRLSDTNSHTINGMTVDQVFSDPDVARLASLGCAGDVAGIVALDNPNPNSVGLGGITPLLWAQDCRNLSGVEALLRLGANPNQRTTGRAAHTPVLVAARLQDPAFLRALLRYGGDPNASYPEGWGTALTKAFERGLDGGEEAWTNWHALLEAGADINAANQGGRQTIATYAAHLNHFEIVVELLERGYSHDLTYLGFVVQPLQHETPYPVPSLSPELEEARARAMAILAQRGVRFPVTRAEVGLPGG